MNGKRILLAGARVLTGCVAVAWGWYVLAGAGSLKARPLRIRPKSNARVRIDV
jgi:hypothetical protein